MIAFPSTLGQLRDEIENFIRVCGEDAPVGDLYADGVLDCDVSLEYVFIDDAYNIVGTEAEDYDMNPQPGTRKAVLVGARGKRVAE